MENLRQQALRRLGGRRCLAGEVRSFLRPGWAGRSQPRSAPAFAGAGIGLQQDQIQPCLQKLLVGWLGVGSRHAFA